MKKILFLSVLLTFVFVLSTGLYAYENPIRVRIGYGTEGAATFTVKVEADQYTLKNTGGTLATVSAGTTLNIAYSANAYTVTCGSQTYTGTGKVTLAAKSSSSIFSYNSVKYTGDVYGTYNSSKNTVYLINYLGIEEYLYGVIGREIGYYAPLEALKAQAVASRCLAYHWREGNASSSYDVTNSTLHQVYGGYSEWSKTNWNQVKTAIDATKDLVMYYERDDGSELLVEAYYCANTGGYTADVQDVWGSDPNRYPFLRGIVVPTDGLPFQSYGTMKFPSTYTWTKVCTSADILDAVSKATGKNLGVLKSIVINRDNNTGGYIETIKFFGTADTATLTRSSARSAFTSLGVKSQLYDVIISDRLSVATGFSNITVIGSEEFGSTVFRSIQYVTFIGRGWGHGVGMSQWSACVMAGQGESYREILNYFYNQNLDNNKLTFTQYKG